MKTVSLVATVGVVRKFFPDAHTPGPTAKPGILSAPFPVVPSACKSHFGAWLAERYSTTRRDDDLSILRIELPATEEELQVREFAQSLQRTPVMTAGAAALLHESILKWVGERKKHIAAYGDACFRRRIVNFDWPVFGSAAGGGFEMPEEYFDFCAMVIRKMQPVAVKTWSNDSPPESFGVVELRSTPMPRSV